MSLTSPPEIKLGAIAVLLHEGRFLLVQRGKDPGRGLWGFPGGHVELGETALQAAARELLEETTVVADPTGYLTNVDVIERNEQGDVVFQYLIAAVACRYQSGTPLASDDAADVAWVTGEEIFEGKFALHDDVRRVAKLMLQEFV